MSRKTITTVGTIIIVLCIAAFGSVVLAAESTGTLDDSGAQKGVDALTAFAKSKWGKLVFFAASLGAIFGLLSKHHRAFGVVCFVFAVAMGAYGNLVGWIWTAVTGNP